MGGWPGWSTQPEGGMATHCPPASVHSFKRVRVACGRPWRAKYDCAQSWRWRTTQRHGGQKPRPGLGGAGLFRARCSMHAMRVRWSPALRRPASGECLLVTSTRLPTHARSFVRSFVRSFDRRDMLSRRNYFRGASVRAFGMERLGEGVGEEGGGGWGG
jgi:hypothetical protein